ncbi:MAG TPA: 30S ribosomal protein S18 [Candidatus Faecimonas intestinavium]|jgi:small subunit ribosomal protein S18|nr:30S ribosomal protein S18 [Candidatus Faecimonas intestinavium]
MNYHSKKGGIKMAEFGRRKKKVCMMCTGATVDYKNPETLKRYVNEKGKIVSRRVTGNCARHQRYISTQIKRARAIALMPYTR